MKLCFALLALLFGALSALAAPPSSDPKRGLGQVQGDFVLSRTDGAPFRFYALAGKKAAVLVFVGADCPVGKLYLPRLEALHRKYAPLGGAFVGIDANANETAAQMAAAAKAHGVTFPIVMDPRQRVADTLQGARTNEALVTDAGATLRYRGGIDDQYGFTTRRAQPTQPWLSAALDAVLAGQAVAAETAPVVGCLLDRLPPLPKVGKVTWARDVAPIVQAKCERCHRPGQIGPFALQTYADARRWSAMMGETVQAQRMPPWHADPDVGHFANDRSLSPLQRAIVLAWVAQGAPAGALAQAPKPRVWSQAWSIGKPDAVLTMDAPFTVAATGVMPYQIFRVPTGFTEDRWIQAAEVRPGARAAVHHVLVFVDDHTGKPMSPIDGQLASYVPGEVPTVFPPGIARRVPKGSDLIFQMHYTPIGKEVRDRTSLALVFAPGPPRRQADTRAIFQAFFAIPPGAADHPVEAWLTVPADATLLSLWPHMHLRGKAMEFTAHYPDGTVETLLRVPRYDFNWQTRYVLAEPKRLPRGTRLHVLARFDNSRDNPANPDPSRVVRWGEQTDSEMMIGYIDYVLDSGEAPTRRRR